MNIPDEWSTEEMIEARQAFKQWMSKFSSYDRKYYQQFCADKIFIAGYKAALAALPTPPAQDEPVAYAARNFMSGKWGYIWHEKDDVQGWITLQHQSRDDVTYAGPTALYTAPQSDKLRQAVEEAANYLETLANNLDWDGTRNVARNLRAALEGK